MEAVVGLQNFVNLGNSISSEGYSLLKLSMLLNFDNFFFWIWKEFHMKVFYSIFLNHYSQ